VEKVARALDLEKLELRSVDLKSPFDLERWNPVTGKMPVLEIDGEKVYDSTFLRRRLDELRPDPPLFSDDPAVAAADLAVYGQLRSALSGPTPEFEALVSERPALSDRMRRVEDRTA
jgi:glutathione S-transferase